MRQVLVAFRLYFFISTMAKQAAGFRALGTAELEAWADWVFAPRKAPKPKGSILKYLHTIARLVAVILVMSRPFYWLWARRAINTPEKARALMVWAEAPMKGAA